MCAIAHVFRVSDSTSFHDTSRSPFLKNPQFESTHTYLWVCAPRPIRRVRPFAKLRDRSNSVSDDRVFCDTPPNHHPEGSQKRHRIGTLDTAGRGQFTASNNSQWRWESICVLDGG